MNDQDLSHAMERELRRAVDMFMRDPSATHSIPNEQTLWALEDRGLVRSVFPASEKRFRECRPTGAGILWVKSRPLRASA